IGVIIPPSIPFVIYCVVAQCSIGDMFIAGIIPGIIIGIALMLVCYITARKRNYKTMTDRPRFSEVSKAFKDSFWALLVPIIILGGIYGGIFTPTEAAVVAVVYSVIIGKFVYRELDMKSLYDCLKSTGLINGATSFLIGLSMAFASYLAMAQIPAKMAAWLTAFVDSPFLLLMIINVFLLIIGCFVDNIAAVIILTPILLPVVKMIGIDPIHFGLIITVNLACGFISPPYGINLFVASAISGESIESISREIIPAFVAMVGCLLLFTYFPIFTMGLLQLIR
ncbi:MAG: TRAP transporter large permease, partial [Clostridiaceae bacterium]|nr:TRAP transporter large permease [Clostridiaceae bacterium]